MSKFAIAGKQLLKGNFGNAMAALVTKSVQSEMIQASRWRGGSFFFGVNGADKAFVWGNYNSSLTAYQECPIVSAVINKKAQALVNGKTYIMSGIGKQAREAQGAQADSLRALLLRPNPMQSWREWRAQNSIYKQIYGYCPILKMVPVGFEADFSKWRIWNVPPWMIQVEDNQDPFWLSDTKPFKNIYLTYMGRATNILPQFIFFMKENQVSTSTYANTFDSQNASLFLPDSKLFYLRTNINTFNVSLNSRDSIVRDRGPQWLMTNDSTESPEAGLFPTDPGAIEKLHEDFLQYGIRHGQRKAIITDAKLKLQEVGFDVAQLKLLEGELQDAKIICDGLNFPPYLLGLVDSKFDNQAIAERGLYTNSIIPDCMSDDEQLTEMLGLSKFGLRIETDFTHIPALQENISEQGQGRMYMNQGILIEWLQDGITWNRWRELLGEDTVAGMDIYYSDMVKSGRILPAATAAALAASANNIPLVGAAGSSSSNSNNNGNAN